MINYINVHVGKNENMLSCITPNKIAVTTATARTLFSLNVYIHEYIHTNILKNLQYIDNINYTYYVALYRRIFRDVIVYIVLH